MLRCTGCGSTETIEQIRAKHPEAIACCPERKMVEQCSACEAKSEIWWNYCAMCGHHIAASAIGQTAGSET